MEKNRDKYLVVVMGPTAIGKTALALELNSYLNSIIISADSRQVYKELSIGTAKPEEQEIISGNIKLVNHVSITEDYTAGHFEREADALIANALVKEELPILCGGTGLYIKAVCEGLDLFPKVSSEIKLALKSEFEQNGLTDLSKELAQKDPKYFENADVQNPQRVIRALSVIRSCGLPFSSFQGKKVEKLKQFKPIYFILELERELLYTRINKRVEQMFEKGLVTEVEKLYPNKNLKALQTVGYNEVFKYLDGEMSLNFCKEEIKKNTRRYAKRQMTWLRNQVIGHRLSTNQLEQMKRIIADQLKKI